MGDVASRVSRLVRIDTKRHLAAHRFLAPHVHPSPGTRPLSPGLVASPPPPLHSVPCLLHRRRPLPSPALLCSAAEEEVSSPHRVTGEEADLTWWLLVVGDDHRLLGSGRANSAPLHPSRQILVSSYKCAQHLNLMLAKSQSNMSPVLFLLLTDLLGTHSCTKTSCS